MAEGRAPKQTMNLLAALLRHQLQEKRDARTIAGVE
jgi:hypothetical protein